MPARSRTQLHVPDSAKPVCHLLNGTGLERPGADGERWNRAGHVPMQHLMIFWPRLTSRLAHIPGPRAEVHAQCAPAVPMAARDLSRHHGASGQCCGRVCRVHLLSAPLSIVQAVQSLCSAELHAGQTKSAHPAPALLCSSVCLCRHLRPTWTFHTFSECASARASRC